MDRKLVISSIVALSILLMMAPLSVLSVGPVMSCSTYIRCSTVPQNTYAISSDGTCSIFRNPCFLGLENCDRKANNETVLVPTTKEKCIPHCPSICPLYVLYICGEYKQEKRTFTNDCEMKRYNCKNDKTFLLYSQGECKKCSSSANL